MSKSYLFFRSSLYECSSLNLFRKWPLPPLTSCHSFYLLRGIHHLLHYIIVTIHILSSHQLTNWVCRMIYVVFCQLWLVIYSVPRIMLYLSMHFTLLPLPVVLGLKASTFYRKIKVGKHWRSQSMCKANICNLSVDFESRVISSTYRSLMESSVETCILETCTRIYGMNKHESL